MVSRYQSKRNLILIRALSKALVSYTDHPKYFGLVQRTRGSAITPGVWTCTTRWTNLMQHTRIPVAAVSHLLRMFDFIAAIFSHVAESWGLLMLAEKQYKILVFVLVVHDLNMLHAFDNVSYPNAVYGDGRRGTGAPRTYT